MAVHSPWHAASAAAISPHFPPYQTMVTKRLLMVAQPWVGGEVGPSLLSYSSAGQQAPPRSKQLPMSGHSTNGRQTGGRPVQSEVRDGSLPPPWSLQLTQPWITGGPREHAEACVLQGHRTLAKATHWQSQALRW